MFGSAFLGVLGLIIWIILAFWPAVIARRKGHSFALFFICSVLFSWLLMLIIALAVKDRNETAQSRADDRAATKALERDEGLED